MIVWHNTGLTDTSLMTIDPMDRGLTLGDGLFETLALRDGRILHLAAHLDRLREGCRILDIPFPTLDLGEALTATADAGNHGDAILRLTLTRGPAPRGLLPPTGPTPTLLITAGPFLPAEGSADCWITTVTRRNEYSPLSRIKALPYLDNILALQEAVAKGGNEAILCNTKGYIAESSRANLVILYDGHLLTPPLTDGVLPGIIRAVLMQSLSIREQSLRPEDLAKADAIILTNSLGLRPVFRINGHKTGQPDAADQLLRAATIILEKEYL